MLREIGHEVLLYSGDSTSRVLPVQKINKDEFQLTFENQFTFETDSLVKIIQHTLSKNDMARDYVVSVLNCSSKDVIFGYAISKKKKDDIIPCSGRKQPKSCYIIDIKFKSTGLTTAKKSYLVGSLSLLAFVGLLFVRSNKGEKKPATNKSSNTIYKLNNTLFDSQKQTLVFAEIVTELTFKENQVLLIFALSPNVVVERARLQKEIWEDEGVIVGRSLDVFISRLRKKLENDTGIRIVNIHGKGYRFEVTS
jgi:DNA-binding winged helix-turn-helix (wHTH) protein